MITLKFKPKKEDLLYLADKYDDMGDLYTKMKYKLHCGHCHSIVRFGEELDLAMSTYYCQIENGDMWENCRQFKYKDLLNKPNSTLNQLFYSTLIIDEKDVPAKMVTESNGVTSYFTMKLISYEEMIQYFEKHVNWIRSKYKR